MGRETSGSPVELVIAASNAAYDENDPRWTGQVADLHDKLRSEAGDVRRKVTPVAGKKGGIEQVILALGSAGAFSAAVAVIKMWLARDRQRVLEVSATVAGKKHAWKVAGTDATDDTLKELMREVMTLTGGR